MTTYDFESNTAGPTAIDVGSASSTVTQTVAGVGTLQLVFAVTGGLVDTEASLLGSDHFSNHAGTLVTSDQGAAATTSVTISFTNGAQFDLDRIDIGELTGAVNETFVLTTNNLDTATTNPIGVAPNDEQRLDVSGNTDFDGITSLTITDQAGDGFYIALDNIVVSNVTANAAPVLADTASPVLTGIAEDPGAPTNGSTTGSTLVSALIDSGGALDNFSDADGNPAGLAVTGVSGQGTLFYSTNDGTTWTELTGTVSSSSALLLAADANTRVYFQPNSNVNGAINDAITFRAWDQSSGTNGTTGVNTGSGTAFSAVTDTVSLNVTAVNDDPTVASLPMDITVTEDVASDVALGAATFADVDSASITVTLTASAGTFATPADGAGVAETLVNATTITLAGAPADITTYLDTAANIQYTGAANASGDNAATITVTANDGDNSGDVNLGTVNLDINEVNDDPVIISDGGGNTAPVSVNENTTTVTTVTATDVEDDGDGNVITKVAFSITGGADRAQFSIDADTGELRFTAAPDFENPQDDQDLPNGGDGTAENTYVVDVTATDSAGRTDVQTLTVTVTDVAEGGGGGGGGETPTEPDDPEPVMTIIGNPGNEAFDLTELTGPVTVDGGDGHDTVTIDHMVGLGTISLSEAGYIFTSPSGQTVTVENVETVVFNDRTLTLDTSLEASVVLFMYEVVVDRFMDLDGLSGWLAAASGGSSFSEIADGFLNSVEFAATFGTEQTNEEFVRLLYNSGFDRVPDEAGFNGWLEALNNGTLTRGDVAAGFAQSLEMANLFQAQLDDGVFVPL